MFLIISISIIVVTIILIIIKITQITKCTSKCPDPVPGKCPDPGKCQVQSITKCPTNNSSKTLKLIRNWNGSDLIPENGKGWDYFMSPFWLGSKHQGAGGSSEPTKSQVAYVNGLLGDNLVVNKNNQLSIDTKTVGVVNDNKSIISSVRLHSTETFDNGLFIIDLDQIPSGDYFWPSFWLLGNTTSPNSWALNGEIDIIEGGWNKPGNVNNNINTSSLHTNTSDGKNVCNTLKGVDCSSQSSDRYCGLNSNELCPYDGCANVFPQQYTNSFGAGFKGGMYACYLECDGSVSIWFFDKTRKPLLNDVIDLTDASLWPKTNPSDNSYYYVNITNNSCKNNFKNLRLIINTAVGGQAFNGVGDRGNPPDFPTAFKAVQSANAAKTSNWLINSIKVYQ